MSDCLLLFFGVCVALPVAAVARTFLKVRGANKRFLARALGAELGADGTARVELRAASPSQHAVWLDLDIGGPSPTFLLELAVTANGAPLASGAGTFGYDSDGDFQHGADVVVEGSPFGMSLENVVTGGFSGVEVQSIQRIAFFTPRLGDLVVVRVVVRPGPDTTLRRCKVLVTDTREP